MKVQCQDGVEDLRVFGGATRCGLKPELQTLGTCARIEATRRFNDDL